MASTTPQLAADGGGNKGGGRTSDAPTPLPPPQPAPLEAGLRCPRCDSPNTKFCYYNNYSLTQPRHYCKACRRYWTRGGALRNVPVGGGCRKHKRPKSSSAPSSSGTQGVDTKDHSLSFAEQQEPAGVGFRFLHGFSTPDLRVGAGALPVSRLHSTSSLGLLNAGNIARSQMLPCGGDLGGAPTMSSQVHGASTVTNTCSLLGSSYPIDGNHAESSGNPNTHTGRLGSTMEPLSSGMDQQDLHWKLQQQRLATLLGFDQNIQKEDQAMAIINNNLPSLPTTFSLDVVDQHQPMSFQMPLMNSQQQALDFAATDQNTKPSIDTTCSVDDAANSVLMRLRNDDAAASTDLVRTWKDMHQFSTLP